MVFEWDEDKAAANLETHGVGFEEAVLVFADENAIEEFDAKHSIDEERFIYVLACLTAECCLWFMRCESAMWFAFFTHAKPTNE